MGHTDIAVALGNDGTTWDVVQIIDDVPAVSILTGMNNVVPTPVNSTVAGATAALTGSGTIPAVEATVRHGTTEVNVTRPEETTVICGLATVDVLDRSFAGTQTTLDPGDIVDGVVSCPSPAEVGPSSIADGPVMH